VEELAETLEPRGLVVGMIHAHDTMVAPLLFLFDIDGTILSTQGAGREALDEAFLRVCGWPDATRGVPIGGSTDGAIVRGVAARFGHVWTDGPAPYDEAAFEEAYLHALSRRLAAPGRVTLCPGVVELLDALEGRAHLALLTGNWVAGARVKLGAVGLADRFSVGAYGGDAVDRNALVPAARQRADAAGLRYGAAAVIGDTPADVACARAGGALAIAVETGHGDPEALRAARPDLLLSDLSRGRDAVLALLD
jgi:phosphoglycolate phosphatase-like HAD superfamily hydrolase